MRAFASRKIEADHFGACTFKVERHQTAKITISACHKGRFKHGKPPNSSWSSMPERWRNRQV